MNSLKKTTICLLFLCIGVNCVFSEVPEQINFSYISINEGLSQSTVFSIDQDQRGNMWFATYDGVNKYDGYSFTVYQHNEEDPNSIANDISRIVKTDSQGRVWIGTRDGLSYYDEEKDKFRNFFYEKKGKRQQINGIAEISPEQLLISTQEGLTMFDIKESRFVDDSFSTAMHKLIASALYRQGDIIYIGTPVDGLYSYSIPQKKLEKITPITETKQIQAILQQSPTRIWIATEGAGLLLLNPKTKEVKAYHHSSSNPKSISSNYIRSLALDSQNRLWIGTFNDLNIYHEGSDSFVSYSSSPVENGSLSQRSVRSIFMDSQGGMWLGTYFGGLNYYHPIRNRFKNIQRIPYKNSLSDNVVSCITEDKDKNLWIGTNDGGLNLYNTKTQQFTHYILQEDEREIGIGSNNIKAVYVDEQKSLVYIGTHAGGLTVLHRNSGKMESFNQLNSQLVNENVYAILPDKGGNLLLGTLSALVSFNPEKKSFTTIDKEKDGTPFTSQRITILFRDSHKRLWVGGEEGISVFQQEGIEIEKVPILPESSVTKTFTNCIYEAANGIIWVGTREGFYCFNEKEKKIKRYTTANGLPNNVVYGILEDTFGRLWVSTNRGISCFNPETERFRNFTESDGLQSNQFNTSSFCRTSSGQMYFGGINGITTFRPELLLDNPYTPPVVITKLQLFNKTVRPDDETGILTKNINETESITLKSWQTAFTIEFVVSNYISGQHNTFAYKLEGYDKEWYYLTDKRTVSYSNLPQGTYHFLVKAANSDGKWNTVPTMLEIIVLPIWYKTWWAIMIFLATFIGFITFVFRFFWMRKSMEAELELERRDKEHQEEINQMKMRFFINISHELRTPLTLILAPLQEIINKISDRWTRNQLEYIQRNANRLLHLVNQLMDYRRAELGVFELKVKKENAHQLIQDNFLFYDKLARHKKITYTLHSELEEKEELFDPNYLELIVNNLLSNAFKYSPKYGTILVSVTDNGPSVLIEVEDNGKGIDKESLPRIFDRFYALKNTSNYSTGIGLHLTREYVELHHGYITADSLPGAYTVFRVELFKGKSHFGENVTFDETLPTNYLADEVIDDNKVNELLSKKYNETIVIAEDDSEILAYLKDELSTNFRVIAVNNGYDAVKAVMDDEVSLILSDVLMPALNGFQLCSNIKSNIATCHIPIVLLTALSDDNQRIYGIAEGADEYIHKPFNMQYVRLKIIRIIEERKRLASTFAQKFGRLTRHEAANLPCVDDVFRDKLFNLIEAQHSDSNFKIELMSDMLGMSRILLYRKITSIFGMSPSDLLRNFRLQKAVQLLTDQRRNVSEVAYIVGFSSPAYFAKCFKSVYNMTPTEYMYRTRE